MKQKSRFMEGKEMVEFIMRKFFALYAVAIALVLVQACSSLGLPTAQTFNERLAVGYGTVTQVRQTATQLVVAKKLGSADAQNVQTQADNARAGLDIARDLSKSDLPAANNRLQMATQVLTALQSYLASRQATNLSP